MSKSYISYVNLGNRIIVNAKREFEIQCFYRHFELNILVINVAKLVKLPIF